MALCGLPSSLPPQVRALQPSLLNPRQWDQACCVPAGPPSLNRLLVPADWAGLSRNRWSAPAPASQGLLRLRPGLFIALTQGPDPGIPRPPEGSPSRFSGEAWG